MKIIERGFSDYQEDIKVEVTHNQYVYIDKSIGPTSAEEVRIHMDIDSGDWIVERLVDGHCFGHAIGSYELEHEDKCTKDKWEEKIRWNCQESFQDITND